MRFLKLLILTVFAVIVLSAAGFIKLKPCFEQGKSYTFFCGTSSADCKTVVCDNPQSEKLRLKNVCGESTEYDNFDLDSFLEQFGGEIVFCEELDDSVNYYCKANLPYSVDLYGQEINLHVCVRGDAAKVGTPIIFGGY